MKVHKKLFLYSCIILSIVGVGILNTVTRIYDILQFKWIFRLAPIIVFICLVFGIVIFIFKKGKKIIFFSVVFLLIIITSNSISTFVIDNQRQSTFSNEEIIINALKNYYRDNQQYPNKLNELVPFYINGIPVIKTTYSKGDFSYFVVEDGKSYYLRFEQYFFNGNGWRQQE